MYKIEKKSSGYLFTFGGVISAEEIQQWYEDVKKELENAPPSFGLIVDMRTLAPLSPEAQKIMVKGQNFVLNKGKKRSAVILNNTITAIQFKRLAKESGVYESERFISVEKNPDWKKVAIDWVNHGTDPDQ